MKTRMKLGAILLGLACIAGFGFGAGWFTRSPEVLPPLPSRAVVVKTIASIPERNDRLRATVQQLVDENLELARTVERLHLETGAVPVSVQAGREVLRVVERGVDLGTLEAEVGADGDKKLGEREGEPRWGWIGELYCRVRAGPDEPWTELARAPFDLASSEAVSTTAPASTPRRPPRWSGYLDVLAGAEGLGARVGVERRLCGIWRLTGGAFGEVEYLEGAAVPIGSERNWRVGVRLRYSRRSR